MSSVMIRVFSCLICQCIFLPAVLAQEVFEYTQTIQDFGRGGTRIPSIKDSKIIFYNPAMMAFVKEINWDLISFGMGTGCAGCSQPSLDSIIKTPFLSTDNLANLYGRSTWLGAGGQSVLVVPNFGLGAYGNLTGTFNVTNPAYPSASLLGYMDYGFILGGGWAFNKDFAFGINLKRVTRRGGTVSVDASTLVSTVVDQNFLKRILDNISNVGSGYGVDAGLLWQSDSAVNPIISLCWQDVGYTPFYSETGISAPPPIEDNLVLGLSMHQNLFGFGWGAGFEYRHINNANIDISKKFHTGIELNLALMDARFGFYQGWPSYGATVDLWFFNLDAAYYTQERGVVAGQLPDYRYSVGISLEASFDPSFQLIDFGGKARRLKQRR